MHGQLWCTGADAGFTTALLEAHFDVSGVQTLQDTGRHDIREICEGEMTTTHGFAGCKKDISVMKSQQSARFT